MGQTTANKVIKSPFYKQLASQTMNILIEGLYRFDRFLALCTSMYNSIYTEIDWLTSLQVAIARMGKNCTLTCGFYSITHKIIGRKHSEVAVK